MSNLFFKFPEFSCSKIQEIFFICTNYYDLLKLNSWIFLFTYILVDMLHQFRVFLLYLVEIEKSILWV